MNRQETHNRSSTPLVSYVLPVHNSWPYLKYAVESVLSIKSEDFELVVSDNHSTDFSKDYLREITDPRVRVISPPRKFRMNANFEFAISHARGDWVQLFGGDDAVLPFHHEILSRIVNTFPHIRIVNWNRGYYFWEEAQKLNGDLVASIEISSKVKIFDSRKRLKRALRGTISLFDLPQLYTTSVVKRDLIIQASKLSKNTFFVGMQPDIFSSMQLLFTEKKYLRIECPLTIVGTSPKSTGAGAFGDFYKIDHGEPLHEMNCFSNLNTRSRISLLASKNSSYYLLDSLFDYFDATKTPEKRKLLRIGFAGFLKHSYLPFNAVLAKEIKVNLKDEFSSSLLGRIPIYILSLFFFVTNPLITRLNRLRTYILKKFTRRLEFKKVSRDSEEFTSIKIFMDQIPQDGIKLLL